LGTLCAEYLEFVSDSRLFVESDQLLWQSRERLIKPQSVLWKDTVWMGMFGNQKKQGDWTQLFPMQKPITS
jgi:hypothetical protein